MRPSYAPDLKPRKGGFGPACSTLTRTHKHAEMFPPDEKNKTCFSNAPGTACGVGDWAKDRPRAGWAVGD